MSSDRRNHNSILIILIPEACVKLHFFLLILLINFPLLKNYANLYRFSEYCAFHYTYVYISKQNQILNIAKS